MKRFMKFGSIVALVMVFVTTFYSCEEELVLPTASFTYVPSDIVQYDIVTFTSTSIDAESYLWDFGNGAFLSTDAIVDVQFLTAGTTTIKLTATNMDGSNTTEQTITVSAPDNNYMLDNVKYDITTDFFWYQSSMPGSTPYLRLISDMPSQDTVQDLLKLYPNMGIEELPQTYTWNDTTPVGTYDLGYTADYDGTFNYEWTAIGKTGSSDLVIEEVDTDLYKITGDMILSVGAYDWSTGEFTETSTKTLKLNYIGAITPL